MTVTSRLVCTLSPRLCCPIPILHPPQLMDGPLSLTSNSKWKLCRTSKRRIHPYLSAHAFPSSGRIFLSSAGADEAYIWDTNGKCSSCRVRLVIGLRTATQGRLERRVTGGLAVQRLGPDGGGRVIREGVSALQQRGRV